MDVLSRVEQSKRIDVKLLGTVNYHALGNATQRVCIPHATHLFCLDVLVRKPLWFKTNIVTLVAGFDPGTFS